MNWLCQIVSARKDPQILEGQIKKSEVVTGALGTDARELVPLPPLWGRCVPHGGMPELPQHKLCQRVWVEGFHLLREKNKRMNPWLWQWLNYSQEDGSALMPLPDQVCLISCMQKKNLIPFSCPRKCFRQVVRAPTSWVSTYSLKKQEQWCWRVRLYFPLLFF